MADMRRATFTKHFLQMGLSRITRGNSITIVWGLVSLMLSIFLYGLVELDAWIQTYLIFGKTCWFFIEYDEKFGLYSVIKRKLASFTDIINEKERKIQLKGNLFSIFQKKKNLLDCIIWIL